MFERAKKLEILQTERKIANRIEPCGRDPQDRAPEINIGKNIWLKCVYLFECASTEARSDVHSNRENCQFEGHLEQGQLIETSGTVSSAVATFCI